MKCTPLAAYVPLVAHVLLTVVIAYGIVIPRSCISGINELTIGFAASVAGTCIAYMVGLRIASRATGSCDRATS